MGLSHAPEQYAGPSTRPLAPAWPAVTTAVVLAISTLFVRDLTQKPIELEGVAPLQKEPEHVSLQQRFADILAQTPLLWEQRGELALGDVYKIPITLEDGSTTKVTIQYQNNGAMLKLSAYIEGEMRTTYVASAAKPPFLRERQTRTTGLEIIERPNGETGKPEVVLISRGRDFDADETTPRTGRLEVTSDELSAMIAVNMRGETVFHSGNMVNDGEVTRLKFTARMTPLVEQEQFASAEVEP